MHPDDFQFLAELLKKRSGLALGNDKAYLIESRLLPIARSQGLAGIAQLCQVIRTNPSEELLVEIIEAMTTNESSFFRDIKPYEAMRQIIFPMLMKKLSASKHMRIWSAACSTGQEPYSIALCIQEDSAKMPDWTFDIIGTDIARKVIGKAQLGVYSQFEAQRGLPIQMLIKYFTSLPDTSWQLKEDVRLMVQYHVLNLLDDYTALGKFDMAFCCNVLLYFDDATKAKIIEKMSRVLQPHGVLVIGATENLVDTKGSFTAMENFRGAYKLKA